MCKAIHFFEGELRLIAECLRCAGPQKVAKQPRTPEWRHEEFRNNDRANPVWCADITYIPVGRGFHYLVGIIVNRRPRRAVAALQAIESALRLPSDTRERWTTAELLRIKARALQAAGERQPGDIETLLLESLKLAQ